MSVSKLFLALALLACCKSVVAQSCPPPGFSRDSLLNLREQAFDTGDTQKVDDLALSLLPCLASEDPQRFYPEMGTLYLRRLGDIAGAALLRNRAP